MNFATGVIRCKATSANDKLQDTVNKAKDKLGKVFRSSRVSTPVFSPQSLRELKRAVDNCQVV